MAQPTATVTVTVITADEGLTPDKTRLTFTPTDWNLSQTVTFNLAADYSGGDSLVNYRGSGGNYNNSFSGQYIAIVTASVPDALLLSPASLRVPEGGDAGYTVRLSAPPAGSVTVAAHLPAGTDLTLDITSLTFTTSNWNTAQTVTVSAGEDDDDVNDTATLLHTTAGGGYSSLANMQVSVIDDDVTAPSLVFSPPSLTVAEGGSDTYTVRLATLPTAQVAVAATGTSGTDLTLAPAMASLTFTTATWNVAQTVTVTAGEDDDAVDDSATLTHTATGGGYGMVTGSVGVTVTDNETVGLAVSAPSLAVAEGGSNTYTVRLSTQPTAQVTVAVTGQAGTDLTLAPASASLTFTTATWNTAQTVTVTAGEDDDAANDAATLLHTASGGDYAGETASVAVTVTDDDDVGLTLSTTALGVTEGDDGEYTVRLSTQPTATVTVAITGQAGTDLTLDVTSLTFTTATWNTAQTVTVSAGEDDDAANDAATLLHTASGGRLRGRDGERCGDGDRRRRCGSDAVDDGAGSDRGGRRRVHGAAFDAADGDR